MDMVRATCDAGYGGASIPRTDTPRIGDFGDTNPNTEAISEVNPATPWKRVLIQKLNILIVSYLLTKPWKRMPMRETFAGAL